MTDSSDDEPFSRVSRPRRAAPADAVRPTRAEINLANLRHNLFALERALDLPRTSRAIWGVLKADAYGHGAPAVARTLERAGIGGLCVALLEEAVELREAGIRAPILVMGGYYGPRREGLEEIPEHDLIPVIYDRGHVERLAQVVRDRGGQPIDVHLKVDSGMGRLGAAPTDLDDVLEALREHRSTVTLAGLMTHFACADADEQSTTRQQLRLFAELQGRVRAAGFSPRVVHAANSAAALRAPESRFDLVRPGIALFGYAPWSGKREPAAEAAVAGLRPVMKVRTEIVALRTVADGGRVGYGHQFVARGARLIATVAMGYADGLARSLSGRGEVLIRGRRAPIAGVVSMDLTAVDVTDVDGARVGDEVVFLGPQEGPLGSDAISAEEIARHTGTIAWEVLTSISRRVPRFYREP
jgi:alanine racemase